MVVMTMRQQVPHTLVWVLRSSSKASAMSSPFRGRKR